MYKKGVLDMKTNELIKLIFGIFFCIIVVLFIKNPSYWSLFCILYLLFIRVVEHFVPFFKTAEKSNLFIKNDFFIVLFFIALYFINFL